MEARLMGEKMGQGSCVAKQARIDQVLDRMAGGVLATLGEVPLVIGILRRGVPLARALAGRLEALSGRPAPVAEVRLKRYADDLTLLHREPQLEPVTQGLEVRGARVLLVDDVLYTGRTLLRAAGWLSGLGAGSVHLAVLCARDARELEMPVRAEFVGLHFDVEPGAIIEVQVPPYEGQWAVLLTRRPAAPAA
jgi:pyrimidine operon attenuation protein/uracil phosphoribosyltransferase